MVVYDIVCTSVCFSVIVCVCVRRTLCVCGCEIIFVSESGTAIV